MELNKTLIIHSGVALAVGIVVFLAQLPMTGLTPCARVADAAIAAVLLSVLLIPLRAVAKVSASWTLSFQQRLLNHVALALLFTLCWIGAEYLILNIVFPEPVFDGFVYAAGYKVVVSLLVYALVTTINARQAETILPDDEQTEEELLPPVSAEQNVQFTDRVTVKTTQGNIEIIPVEDIVHIQAEGDYVMIYSLKGKHLKEQTMKSLQESLPPDRFVRVHRSDIVNVKHISQIELYDKQTRYIIMKNGDRVRSSVNGYALLKSVLQL